MNNILKFEDFLNIHNLEVSVYQKEINEGTGIKGVFNKRAGKKIARKLKEEIEMSKSIMDGIRKGLDELNDSIDIIKKDIDKDEKDSNKIKGEKQKKLDEITKILEDSKKQTWDINELIDEGEIDYAGFTANVGFATVIYFGVLLFPVRANVIVHKGYNYFFTLLKNTVRKALVMLQINFDQFQNLIIYQGFANINSIQNMEALQDATELMTEIRNEVLKDKSMSKRRAEELSKKMKTASDTVMNQYRMNKMTRESDPYGALSQYDNTYTKTLDTLRQYSQEDVQKELDAIRNSMVKLAGGDEDFQAYVELVLASAEEHAYKVSTSIYNKFAKMSEVFSLPNQKKMIDLIKAASLESENASKKKKDELLKSEETEDMKKKAEENEKKAEEIFNSLDGCSVGKKDDDNVYHEITNPEKWTYEEFKKIDNDDDRELFEEWLSCHPEVIKDCDATLKVVIVLRKGKEYDDYNDYVDIIVDEIDDVLNEDVSESFVKYFSEYILEESKNKGKNIPKSRRTELDEIVNDGSNSKEDIFKKIVTNHRIETKRTYDDINYVSNVVKDEWKKYFREIADRIDKALDKKNKEITLPDSDNKITISINAANEIKKGNEKKDDEKKDDKKKTEYFIDFSKYKSNSGNIKKIKQKFFDKDGNESEEQTKIAKIAFEIIGDKILHSKSFEKKSEEIVDCITNSLKNTKEPYSIRKYIYDILSKNMDDLKKYVDNGYAVIESNDEEKGKSED